jgi:3-deoxy-manno-octulosonate cytidylyltransferase (CMP-KDO synthetase)
MARSKHVLLIPARHGSARFPGKPLAPISGVSMIQRIYQNMESSKLDCYVVTDDARIEEHVLAFGGRVLRVDDDVICGTERINLAYHRFLQDQGYQLVLNVQGDEPLLPGHLVAQLADFHAASSCFEVGTFLIRHPEESEQFLSPHMVKAIFTEETKECHYFSRSPIPFSRNLGKKREWYQHVGVYSYTPKALAAYAPGMKFSRLEEVESLEQLRVLEKGMKMGAMVIQTELASVDVPEDIERVEKILNKSQAKKDKS